MSHRVSARPGQHRTPVVAELANNWWERLISAVWSGSLADQTARYAAHRTHRDYLFNSLGLALWGSLFPLLAIVCAQLAGAERAGMFSMAFVVASLLQFVGTYGIRTYQVSDVDESDSFAAYQLQRLLSCALMLASCWAYAALRGYSAEMLSIFWPVSVFRATDALADVFEGRLQQCDKLWLAGISQSLRCGLGIVGFVLALLLSGNVALASRALAAASLASLVLVSVPLAYFETPRSRSFELVELHELFVECAPAFLGQFLFALIEAVPKFVMEGVLPYESQLYFSAIYFPSQAIAMTLGLVYKPQLVRLANIWADPRHRRRFDLVTLAMALAAATIAAATLGLNALVGIPLMGVLYGLDFGPYRTQLYLMVLAGGMAAFVDFLYQVITVLRYQGLIVRAFLVALASAVVLSLALIPTVGFFGAVLAYLTSMALLMALLALQYLRIRLGRTR